LATPEYFKRVDEDGDGRINPREFRKGVGAPQIRDQLPPPILDQAVAFVDRVFAYADIDGDGALDWREAEYAEVVALAATQARTVARVAEVARSVGGDVAARAAAALRWPELEEEFGQEFARDIMHNYDLDGDGELSREEYDAGMRRSSITAGIGAYLNDPDVLAWYDELFARSDVDGDGVLNLKEVHYAATLCEVVYGSPRFAVQRVATLLLAEMDENEDGRISEEEVVVILAEMKAQLAGEVPEETPLVAEVQAMFGLHDVDGDKSLDLQETKTMAESIVKSVSRL